ncbi:MAG TPA: glycosyltransferase family 1 protein, partial [Terrimesophilobacter sp.]|nr:glycosyltransferase family 1 protein [Terrimesophilobacter sp.]
QRDYGMRTAHYDFGSDPSNYPLTNEGERGEVLFYARPSTPRRGFELGVLALELFHRDRPKVGINLVGQKLKGFTIPFPHSAPGSLSLSELAALYNRCRAGLVISLTNLSLLPLELLSAGVIPVLGDDENNRMVSDNPFIEYAELSPRALADRLMAVVDRADAIGHATLASASVGESSWSASAEQFLAAFDRGVRGR